MDDDFKDVRIATKRKRDKEKKKSLASKESVASAVRCPICQVPFLNEKRSSSHLINCQGTRENAEECPDGLNCLDWSEYHFQSYSHFKLALFKSHEETASIKKSHITTDEFHQEQEYKKSKISNPYATKFHITSNSYTESTVVNKKCGNFIGEICFTDEIVLSKKMIINSGALDTYCDICNKNENSLTNKFCPTVNIGFVSKTTDMEQISFLQQESIQLSIVYNEKGCKRISIDFVNGFEIRDFHLAIGNCCHFFKLTIVFGKEQSVQQNSEKYNKTLAFFDFNSLGLNKCTSPEIGITEKLNFKCDIPNCIVRKFCEDNDRYSGITNDDVECESLTLDKQEDDIDRISPKKIINKMNECLYVDNIEIDTYCDSKDIILSPTDTQNTSVCGNDISSKTTTVQDNMNGLTEGINWDDDDVKEKWKTLFKKNNTVDKVPDVVGNVNFNTVSQKTSKKLCPFYKRIPGTSFAVDAFQYGVIPGVTHYFLTHFHSDHYYGLTKKFSQSIICSAVTAALAMKKLRIDKRYLRVVKLAETFIIQNVKITPLDANHCPGSFMFLFQLDSGSCYLHVGDFRANSNMELYPAFNGINVDVLYLDTTYCNPHYEFPTQEEVVDAVVRITLRHLQLEPATLIVSGTYTIGKEKVFIGIANACKSKIWASKEKRNVLMCLCDQELISKLVDYPCKAQVHVWPMTNLNHQALQQHLRDCSQVFKRLIAFSPSGWNFKQPCSIDNIPAVTRGNVSIFSVPYSEHSSYSELKRFVRFLKPRKVVPTVASRNQSFKTITQCCTKWLTESEENTERGKQQTLTSFFKS